MLNNAIATGWICAAALAHGAEAFLLVSSDKAVKPSSVMGATKRLAEMTAMSFNGRGATRFMAVRFGNVLGSSGSVLTGARSYDGYDFMPRDDRRPQPNFIQRQIDVD